MSINSDYQKLEPGNTVRLFEVDGTAFGVADVLRFHSYNIPHTEAEIEATNPVSPIRFNKPVLDSRVIFTRAGAASYIGQDGKIYQAAANLWPLEYLGAIGRTEPESSKFNALLYSNAFTNSAWSKSAVTVSTGFAAPDGSTNACKIVPSAASGIHEIAQSERSTLTAGDTFTTSIFVKAVEASILQIRWTGGATGTNGSYQNFDISNSTMSGNALSASIIPIENGWFRCSATVVITGAATANKDVGFGVLQTLSQGRRPTYTGNGIDGLLVWGAQVEIGSVASSQINTTTAIATRPTASASIPANGSSGLKVTYSTGETATLSFGSASSVAIPAASKPWGTRYITKIEYIGGSPSYDESKLPAKSIWWQGIEYSAWPCQIEGIESSTTGSSAQPKLTVANLDGSITALCLAYDDMLQAKVSIHDTLAKYLDARNFPEGNTSADPTQEKLKVYYIDSKSVETKLQVEFTLSSPMDLQGLQIPTRQLHSLCTWCIRGKYRSGDGCDYAGTRYFDKFNKPVSDPSLDVCSGNLTGCKLRFGENNELSFGGFPGTSLLRT